MKDVLPLGLFKTVCFINWLGRAAPAKLLSAFGSDCLWMSSVPGISMRLVTCWYLDYLVHASKTPLFPSQIHVVRSSWHIFRKHWISVFLNHFQTWIGFTCNDDLWTLWTYEPRWCLEWDSLRWNGRQKACPLASYVSTRPLPSLAIAARHHNGNQTFWRKLQTGIE